MQVATFTALSMLPDGESWTLFVGQGNGRRPTKQSIGLERLDELVSPLYTVTFGRHNTTRSYLMVFTTVKLAGLAWIRLDRKKALAFMKREDIEFEDNQKGHKI